MKSDSNRSSSSLRTVSTPGPQRRRGAVVTVVAVAVALAMFLAASGDGSPGTEQPLPDWFNIGANIFAAAIGVLVLVPRTRARCFGGALGALVMVLSMVANFVVDGLDFFVHALPFNLVTLVLGVALVIWHREALHIRGSGGAQ